MRILLLIVMAGFSSLTFASDWISPIDKKYQQKNQDLFNKFIKTRDLVSSWRGQNEKLVAADKQLREILEDDSNYAPVYSCLLYTSSTLGLGFKQEGFLKNHLFDQKLNRWISVYQNSMLIEEFGENTQLVNFSKRLLGYKAHHNQASLFHKLNYL